VEQTGTGNWGRKQASEGVLARPPCPAAAGEGANVDGQAGGEGGDVDGQAAGEGDKVDGQAGSERDNVDGQAAG
jgi:hypothetical protein